MCSSFIKRRPVLTSIYQHHENGDPARLQGLFQGSICPLFSQEIIRALGTPSLDQLRAMQASGWSKFESRWNSCIVK